MSARFLTLVILFVFYTNGLLAQSEHTLGFMENVYQSTYSNPTSIPQHKVSIGLPGISSVYFGITNTGFSYNQLVRGDSLDIDNALKKMRRKNYIYTGAGVDLFHLRVKVQNSFISFHIKDNITSRFSYPKDLISLAWHGNYQFAGDKANFASLGLDATYYREFGIGYVKEGKNWDFGGRIKLLQGFANVHTRTKKLALEVEREFFDLTFASDASLNTAGFNIDDESEFDPLSYQTNFKNKGLAFDLGGTYKLSDKWHFYASLNNIGFIRWKDKVNNYNVTGGTTFEGVDYPFFRDDLDAGAYFDSLTTDFKYSETRNYYTTWIIPQFYARAKYNLTKRTMFNAALSVERYKALRTAATIGATQEIGRIFNILLSYTVQYRSYDNFGIGVMLKPGPFQFYFVTDYLIRQYKYDDDPFMINTGNAKALNARIGMNLVFGRIREAEKQTAPKY